MKTSILYLAFPILLLSACSGGNSESEAGFELKGKLGNAHGDTLYLEQMATDGLIKVDTAILDENGEFTMNPTIKEIGFYRLKTNDRNFATFIFDVNQKVNISGDVADLGNSYTVEGSPDSKLFWEINQVSADNYRKRDSLQKIFQAFVNITKMDSIRIDSMSDALEKPYTELVDVHNQYLKNFIEKNSSSFAALAAIQQLPPEEFMDTYFKLDEGLYAKYPASPYIKAFHEGVAASKKIAPGTMAPEINMNTPEEKPLALSSLRGKVVLIDFWASWCGPCRAENPNVVKAYNKYKSKGFDIYSVSLDKDMDKWKQAIMADKLSWKSHVCDFKFWQSPVVALYNFNSIPTNVLIDKEGKIIAKNLRGEELDKKLEELFK
ncbi:MAG TPA: TlpA disulfide reductase family protein [Bacteroidia bacterium]|jgi:thiol-disulfide isomerase/thioredoxin